MIKLLKKDITMKNLHVGLISFLFSAALCSTSIFAQNTNNLEQERTKQLQEMGILLPNAQDIINLSDNEFGKQIENQSEEVLLEIVKQSNHYANLVSKIYDEYSDYIRDNSRYEFVTNEVNRSPLINVLAEKDSVFKTIRNQAYINLGRLALAEGEDMKAFLLFNDAFRLSSFSCYEGKDNCIRYTSEQYMKELLGIEGESYVHWKK
jgi:hypothetical protein